MPHERQPCLLQHIYTLDRTLAPLSNLKNKQSNNASVFVTWHIFSFFFFFSFSYVFSGSAWPEPPYKHAILCLVFFFFCVYSACAFQTAAALDSESKTSGYSCSFPPFPEDQLNSLYKNFIKMTEWCSQYFLYRNGHREASKPVSPWLVWSFWNIKERKPKNGRKIVMMFLFDAFHWPCLVCVCVCIYLQYQRVFFIKIK